MERPNGFCCLCNYQGANLRSHIKIHSAAITGEKGKEKETKALQEEEEKRKEKETKALQKEEEKRIRGMNKVIMDHNSQFVAISEESLRVSALQ